MALKPLADRMVVKRIDEQGKTKSGLVLPDTAKEKPQEGKVLSVGSGALLEDGTVKRVEVKSGDRVLFGKYAGTEIQIDGEEYLILRESYVLAIVN